MTTETLKLKRLKTKPLKIFFVQISSLPTGPFLGPLKKVLIPKYGVHSFCGKNY